MVTDEHIKATIVHKMHRKGYYCPSAVPVEAAAQMGLPNHVEGRAKALIDAMAKNDACPLRYKAGSSANAVCLKQDSEGWTKNWIQQHDESVGMDADIRVIR